MKPDNRNQMLRYLAYAQPEADSCSLHISKKLKEQTPEKRFALIEKKISHEIYGRDKCIFIAEIASFESMISYRNRNRIRMV